MFQLTNRCDDFRKFQKTSDKAKIPSVSCHPGKKQTGSLQRMRNQNPHASFSTAARRWSSTFKRKKKNDFQHALQYLGVMVHPQCQCGWLSNHHGNTPLGCLSGYFQKGWTEDGRSTQNVGTTIDWAVMPGWLQRKLAGYQHLLPSAVWPRTQWPGSWGSMLSLLVGNCTLRS